MLGNLKNFSLHLRHGRICSRFLRAVGWLSPCSLQLLLSVVHPPSSRPPWVASPHSCPSSLPLMTGLRDPSGMPPNGTSRRHPGPRGRWLGRSTPGCFLVRLLHLFLHLTAVPSRASERGSSSISRSSRTLMAAFAVSAIALFTSWQWAHSVFHLDHGIWSMLQILGWNTVPERSDAEDHFAGHRDRGVYRVHSVPVRR